MAELQFHAAREDIVAVLDFIFRETDCRVFEAYSEYDCDLRTFVSVKVLDAAFGLGVDEPGNGLVADLALWSPSTCGRADIERIPLDPPGHNHWYQVTGWGLMRLQLGGAGAHGISVSRFAHNTESRARAWGGAVADEWDWGTLEAVSKRIRAHIRRLATARWGSGRGRLVRPILPHAERLWLEGIDLAPN